MYVGVFDIWGDKGALIIGRVSTRLDLIRQFYNQVSYYERTVGDKLRWLCIILQLFSMCVR